MGYKKRVKQTGKTHVAADRKLKAKKPGWRRAADGDRYFENRRNRSDQVGIRI